VQRPQRAEPKSDDTDMQDEQCGQCHARLVRRRVSHEGERDRDERNAEWRQEAESFGGERECCTQEEAGDARGRRRPSGGRQR
jgi:hypothetical protein